MPRTRRNQTLGVWMGLTGGVTPELAAGLPHIQDAVNKLVAFQDEMGKLVQDQAFHDARKQEATSRINEILAEGRIVATVLQASLKQHFGSRSEYLVQFGIKPFRGLKRARKAAKKAAAAPEPSAE
jgi:hypothetical protein